MNKDATMKTWIVTHTNLSDEKFYYKVRATSRKEAKQYIATKHNFYLCTLTAVASKTAEIFTFMGHMPIVIWDYHTQQ